LNRFPEIFNEIKTAYKIMPKIAHHTPVYRSNTFSRMTGGEVYLKLESLQRTGSFKIRGAYYALSQLSRDDRRKGCVAVSAGNHAQGVAYAASALGIRSIIIMPEFSSAAKILATKSYGAEIILHGKSYDEAYNRAMEVCEEKGSIFIHPFDNLKVIAGQGTMGLEVLEDIADLDVLMVPVGGGGLISGISIALRNLRPNIKIYGVQAAGAPSMARSFKEGKIIVSPEVDTIADGLAIKRPGELTFKIVSELVDDVITVEDEEIVNSMFLLLERCKQVVEPAGAVGLAALLSEKKQVKGKKVAVIISGGNVDMSFLGRIMERALIAEGRIVKILGLLPDRPGTLKDVLMIAAKARANVVTIEHDRVGHHIAPGRAEVTITLEVSGKEYLEELLKLLRQAGYDFKLKEA
jgi:threonine dehydratase